MVQLFRRAHRHGISALFTTREYVIGPESCAKAGLGGFAWARRDKEGFQRSIDSYDTTFAVNNDLSLNMKDQCGPYSVNGSAQGYSSDERGILAPDPAHLRQDVHVRACER